MNWLQQASKALNAGAGMASILVPVFGPILSHFVPKTAPVIQNISDELPGIAAILLQVQSLGEENGLTGPQKIMIAVPFVTQVVLKSPLAIGKRVQDQPRFQKGVTNLTEGVLDILKSFDVDPALSAAIAPEAEIKKA